MAEVQFYLDVVVSYADNSRAYKTWNMKALLSQKAVKFELKKYSILAKHIIPDRLSVFYLCPNSESD